MRLELTRVSLLVELANHYTIRGTLDEHISDILLQMCQCWLTRTYLQQLCIDIGSNLEDLQVAMDDRDLW